MLLCPFGIILEKKSVRISFFFHALALHDVGQGCDVCLWELFCVFSFWIVWHGALAMLFCPFLSRAFRGVFSAQKRAVVTEKKAERKRSFFNLYNFEPSNDSEKFFTFACRSWGENK